MNFSKAYNRTEWTQFLQHSFLPEDFELKEETVNLTTQNKYTTEVTKLGTSSQLDLVVYEIRHTSTHDARVGLSREAFRILKDEMQSRALVLFTPKDNASVYRFSLIEITLDWADDKVVSGYSNPRRFSYRLGEGIATHTPDQYLEAKGRVVDEKDLLNRFSVEVLTKDFYSELSDWYAWAIKQIRFPNDIKNPNDDDKYNHEGAIRLITRLIFVWFLKQHHLIPDEFFDEKYLADKLLKDFNPHERSGMYNFKVGKTIYYKAILQNLFFAMLNCPITAEGSTEITERRFRKEGSSVGYSRLMRYENLFKDPGLFVRLANGKVPFLNGGLFDCLDDRENGIYYDAFSERKDVQMGLVFPDYLFFGDNNGETVDLSDWYGDKNKKHVLALGIIDILKRYNFTVEENTPYDKEVSLDPELLGKVFENLLAAYNPETQTTARKQTGSFYTPREIVQYMVDESLVAHLKRTVGEDLEPEYRKMLAYEEQPLSLSDQQRRDIMLSLYNCKILDPACGSGAFPMGILQQMVHVLNQIDPDNSMWRELMERQATDEASEAFRAATKDERDELLADISRSFDQSINRPDYARKLYLIENCIYGVDIQSIAIQISKLRFFISLVIDQMTNTDPVDNFGIRPLPNLEAKFVAANTLIGLSSELSLGDTKVVQDKKKEMKEVKHRIFSAKTLKTKKRYKNRMSELRQSLADTLLDDGFVTESESQQLAGWDMFDQNASSPFFDPDWMFGVKNGFDIVIGNPPYVLINSKNYNESYKSHFKYQEGKKDLYRMFIEHSLCHLMTDKGVLSFITPNTFLTIPSSKKLRKLIVDNFSFSYIDNYDTSVFKSVSVNSIVFSVTKERCLYTRIRNISKENIESKLVKIRDYINYKDFSINIFIDKSSNELLNKMQDAGTPLGDIPHIQMILGAQPYHNTIHSKEQIEKKFLHAGYKVNSNYYQDFGGKNIHRYYFDVNCKKWVNFSGEFYMKPDFTFFSSPRIILREISGKALTATYVEETFIVNKSVYIIKDTLCNTSNLKFLLGILNSKLVGYFVNAKGDKSAQILFPRITMRTLKMLPIPPKSDKLANIVSQILSTKKSSSFTDTSSLENQIDFMVYKLYGLTYDEVLVVDPQTPIKRVEYEAAEQ